MTFSSHLDARQFLINKIIAESASQGVPLSEVERRLLLFSVDEPESATGIPEEYLEDTNEVYEEKITGLLKAAYERDQDNPQEREQYKDALRELKGSDHYILVMAVPALAQPHLTQPHTVRDLLLYIVIALAIAGGAIIFAIWRG